MEIIGLCFLKLENGEYCVREKFFKNKQEAENFQVSTEGLKYDWVSLIF